MVLLLYIIVGFPKQSWDVTPFLLNWVGGFYREENTDNVFCLSSSPYKSMSFHSKQNIHVSDFRFPCKPYHGIILCSYPSNNSADLHVNKYYSRPRWLSSVYAPSDWRPGGRGFNPRRGRQHSFVEIDHEIFPTVILSLPLIQEGPLSVSVERMCTILVNRLED